jgi:hypothetical protein
VEPRTILIGQGTLFIHDEDFINGYQAGHLSYRLQATTTTFTNTSVTEMLLDKLASVESREQYSVGFIVGWIATLVLKGQQVATSKGMQDV